MLVHGSSTHNDTLSRPQPPLPPIEFRKLVCGDDALFDLNDGSPFVQLTDPDQYASVFDFGCGCGRFARQLLNQANRPKRYVGIDIHRGMIQWCQDNLSTIEPAFQFCHHDVWNLGLGPDNTRQSVAAFPVGSAEFRLVNAHSVFTHLTKEQTEFYLAEISRILAADGVARTTWFLFDRTTFPMLFDFQVTLFINEVDPSNAVIYDWQWLLETMCKSGLRVSDTVPPAQRGFEWELYLRKSSSGEPHEFPADAQSHLKLSGSGTRFEPLGDKSHSGESSPALSEEPPDELFRANAARSGHLLRFTGDLSAEEFRARCSELPFWYHSYYFENGFCVRGDYDIGADVDAYDFPPSMEGMKVLDIGTGAGWFAIYFEQLGADVVSVDARGYCDFDMYGRHFYPPIETENRPPDRFDEDQLPIYYSPVSRGFWTMKDILGAKVGFKNSRVYDINPALFGGEKFDLVFLGAILCHLRDPIGALMAARSVCRHRVIASTPVVLGETGPDVLPRQYLPYTNDDRISWWLPNEACFRHWFLAAGFTGVDVSRQVNLRCDVLRSEEGRPLNGEQTLRVGSAFVP